MIMTSLRKMLIMEIAAFCQNVKIYKVKKNYDITVKLFNLTRFLCL